MPGSLYQKVAAWHYMDSGRMNNYGLGVHTAKSCRQPITRIGYDYPLDVGIPADLIDGKGTPRTHPVHVVVLDPSQWQQYIVFRAMLRANRALATGYEKLKKELANIYADDRAKYTAAKADFVGDVMKRHLT